MSSRLDNISAILGHLWTLNISLFQILCIPPLSCQKVAHTSIAGLEGSSSGCLSKLEWMLRPSSHLLHLLEPCLQGCSRYLHIVKNQMHFHWNFRCNICFLESFPSSFRFRTVGPLLLWTFLTSSFQQFYLSQPSQFFIPSYLIFRTLSSGTLETFSRVNHFLHDFWIH